MSNVINEDKALYRDVPLPVQKKFTIIGIASIICGLLSIGFDVGGFANNTRFGAGFGFISGIFSLYVGVLYVFLCRQQIYVLKTLFWLLIIQFGLVLSLFICQCLLTGRPRQFQCTLEDHIIEEYVKRCKNARVLSILTIIVNGVLLVAVSAGLLIVIRERRTMKQAAHNTDENDGMNDHLLAHIPSAVQRNLRTAALFYIAFGVIIIALDVAFLLVQHPFSYCTGFANGIISIIYAVILIVLSRRRISSLTSLFCFTLGELVTLVTTFLIFCALMTAYAFPCSSQEPSSDSRCRQAKGIAIAWAFVVLLALGMTVWHMIFVLKQRRRQQLIEEPMPEIST